MKWIFMILAVLAFAPESRNGHAEEGPMRIAFMPDVHFHDVYGSPGDGSFAGVPNPINGKNAFIRTMYAQLTSTRLFNENYFIFLAALDDAVIRGLKYIVMPGDFTDDGQPVHTLAIKKVMDRYAENFGLVFLLGNGNHDPLYPYGRPSGKKDFLGADGGEQRVYSRGMKECRNYDGESASIDTGEGSPIACTEVIRELGYAELGDMMAAYGFKPQRSYPYWETPFSSYDQHSYDFEAALIESRWENRSYETCLEGAGGDHKQPGYTVCAPVPDSSYLVELENDVWLMVVDANIYRIAEKAEKRYPTFPGLFTGSSGAGYNAMKAYKPHLVDWMTSVVERARANGKRLVTVSHFPMTEYYGGVGADIVSLFGKGRLQTGRLPSEKTMKMLADTGIGIHVGGHMHVNSTSSFRSGDNFLVNIQAPSPSSYVSGYKIMTLHDGDRIEIETIQLDTVPRFDELFPLYRIEHKYLSETNSDRLWDASILETKTFREYSDAYFRALTRHRFLPREWPDDMRAVLTNISGADLLTLSQLPSEITLGSMTGSSDGSIDTAAIALGECLSGEIATTREWGQEWAQAREGAARILSAENLSLDDLSWDGFELMLDFHRIINAGELALADIPPARLAHYEVLDRALAVRHGVGMDIPVSGKGIPAGTAAADWAKTRPGALLRIMFKRLAAEPSDHFMIDFSDKTVRRID